MELFNLSVTETSINQDNVLTEARFEIQFILSHTIIVIGSSSTTSTSVNFAIYILINFKLKSRPFSAFILTHFSPILGKRSFKLLVLHNQ